MLIFANTYVARALLLVFMWVLLPTHTIHDLFANHHDTADNFCAENHKHLGTHVEEQHTHCDILNLNSPTYHPPVYIHVANLIAIIVDNQSFYLPEKVNSVFELQLPSRAPPVVA